VIATNYLKDIREKDRDSAIRSLFGRVFGTPDGALVLSILLDDLYWSRGTENEEQSALRNYALVLMKDRIGIQRDNLATVVAMFNTRGD